VRKYLTVFFLIIMFTVVACQQQTIEKELTDREIFENEINDETEDFEIITENDTVDHETDEYPEPVDEVPDIDLICKKLKIKNIEKMEESYGFFYMGAASIIDGEKEHIIKFNFFNEDGSSDYQIEEKDYDLGSLRNIDPYSCTECLWVMGDIVDGKPGTFYFQESGLFKVDSAGKNIEAKGTINARLIEVEINEEVEMVPGGRCIEIENEKIDTFCYPQCEDKVCGSDGCGGICGEGCKENEYCGDDQTECVEYDCEKFEIINLRSMLKDHRFFYEADITNIDGEEKDILYLWFFNEDKSWRNYQIEEKIYDLGSPDNLEVSTCEQCLRVFGDIVDDEPQTMYFQESGTLNIEKAGQNIEAKGTLSARLVEVALVNEKYERVKEGKCIEIEDGQINTLCYPKCENKVCGSDGCGGICGEGCKSNEYCSADQTACIEYECEEVTIKSGRVHLGEGPDAPYEMAVYMKFNESISGHQDDDLMSVEIWSKLMPETYYPAEYSTISVRTFSYNISSGIVHTAYGIDAGALEIIDVDYNIGVFKGKIHDFRMVEISLQNLQKIPGGKCIEVNGEVSATTEEPSD